MNELDRFAYNGLMRNYQEYKNEGNFELAAESLKYAAMILENTMKRILK